MRRLFIFFFNRPESNFSWWFYRNFIGNCYCENNLLHWGNEANRTLIRKTLYPQKIVIYADIGNIIHLPASRTGHINGLTLFKNTAEIFIFLKGSIRQFISESWIYRLIFKKGICQ